MKKNKNLTHLFNQTDNTFASLLQDFPPALLQSAKEFAAFRRQRKIKSVEQLFQTVLLYCGLDFSLRDTAGVLTLLGTEISDQAVSDRLSACAAWLSAMLQEMLPAVPVAAAAEVGRRWLLIDGSTVQAPGATGTSYRLHLGWDWLTQTMVEMRVTDVRTGESLQLYDIQAGDVVLADRGYARFTDCAYVLARGGNLILRYAPQILPVLDEMGGALKLADELWASDALVVSRKVVMRKDESKQGLYLHCFRLPPEKAAEARRKKRATASRKGHKLKKETLEYAEWVIILTSFAPERISAGEIGPIYRLRWQIEIVIKRLKSVLELDKLRARVGGKLAQVYLLGKSLYALLIERRAGKLGKVQELEWRMWKMVAEQVRPLITQIGSWQAEYLEAAIKQLRERKRRRRRQSELANELLIKVLSTT